MNNNATLALYDEFLQFRDEFLKESIAKAVFTDTRDGEKVRPLVVIKTEEEFKELSRNIKKWRKYAKELTELDPIRFDENAKIFKPEPQIFTDAIDIFVRKHNATSTRKVFKARIVTRMKNLLVNERLTAELSGDWSRAETINAQIATMESDDEEHYRIRTDGYTDVMALIRLTTGSEPVKHRVPFAGMFLYERNNPIRVSLPEESRQEQTRRDTFAALGLNPIPCSLPIKGQMYRESEIIAAKKRAKHDVKD